MNDAGFFAQGWRQFLQSVFLQQDQPRCQMQGILRGAVSLDVAVEVGAGQYEYRRYGREGRAELRQRQCRAPRMQGDDGMRRAHRDGSLACCDDADPIVLAQELRPAMRSLPITVVGICEGWADNEDMRFCHAYHSIHEFTSVFFP